MLTKTHKLTFLASILVGVAFFVLSTGKSNAATLNVVAGNDAIQENDQCQLSEAIRNVNDQAQTFDDCPAGDGNNDTIVLPSGTITRAAQPTDITKSITIQGQGAAQTIIDSAGDYAGFTIGIAGTDQVTISQLKIRAFKGFGFEIQSSSNNPVNLTDVEIDGTGAAPEAAMGGILAAAKNISITDVYIHDLNASSGFSVFGLSFQAVQNFTINATVKNLTVDNISSSGPVVNGLNVSTGLLDGSLTPANINLSVSNATISRISATGNNIPVSPVSILAAVNEGTSNVNVALNNTTIDAASSNQSLLSGGIGIGGAAAGAQDSANVAVTLRNSLLSFGSGKDCNVFGDAAELIGLPGASAGTITQTVTSQGGNISDDNTCAQYFTQTSDKNNVTGLKDTLNSIANNGGSLPTILPKPGSLAIDGGVCGQGVPTTDARGIARPQGKTCDSGAVEVQQATLASANGLTSADGSSKIYFDMPVAGAVLSVATLGNLEKDKDSGYEYPFGMLGFTVQGVPVGSTQTINIYFESEKDAEQFVARKYTASNKKYFDLPDATLSNATRNNKPVIKLTYQIKDGGDLDADGQANGILVDPVGVALETGILANTGVPAFFGSFIGAILILGGTLVYFDYRRHKAPLLEADKELHSDFAKSYTFWHHLKVVTIPTAHYKLTIRLDKKVNVKA